MLLLGLILLPWVEYYKCGLVYLLMRFHSIVIARQSCDLKIISLSKVVQLQFYIIELYMPPATDLKDNNMSFVYADFKWSQHITCTEAERENKCKAAYGMFSTVICCL